MLGKFGNFLQVFAPPCVIEENDRLKIHADISPDLNSLSSQHHGGSFSTLRATIGFFTPVGYHCHSKKKTWAPDVVDRSARWPRENSQQMPHQSYRSSTRQSNGEKHRPALITHICFVQWCIHCLWHCQSLNINEQLLWREPSDCG